MKKFMLLLLSLLLLTGCTDNSEITQSTAQSTENKPTQSEEAAFSYYVEPTQVNMTDELTARLSVYFQPLSPSGTVLNHGQSRQGLCVRADDSVQYQTVEGFGASGCWWACFSDSWPEESLDEALTLLYSKQYGIGLTTFRHNIGGGTSEGFSGKGATKCVEVFPGYYDLSIDEQGVRVLYKLQSLGVEYFTLFMNSPPARMTVSGSSLGAIDGGSNLREECFEEYARFCADIAELYTKAGIPVKYVSPINEPQWDWNAAKYQEGCHYTAQEVERLDVLTAQEFAARGLTAKVSIPETAAWYDEVYSRFLVSTLNQSKGLKGRIDHIAGHSYGAKAFHKADCAKYYEQMGITLPVHQTEWCIEGDASKFSDCLSLSRTIHEDLTLLNCTLWEYWVAVDPPYESRPQGGSLIFMDAESGEVHPNWQLFLMGQYSKFITGATRIGLTLDETDGVYGSAYSKDGKTIVILTNETEQPQNAYFEGLDGKIAEAWQTSPDASLQYIGDVEADSGCTLPAQSVTTFVFS